MGWVCTLLHIETLFAIAVVAVCVYLLYKYRSAKKCLERLNEIAGRFVLVPKEVPLSKEKKINVHEEKCREIFEDIFHKRFKSVRPEWLKNPISNRNLELDGYCDSIRTPKGTGLAFEYDGEQHSRYIPGSHFHRHGPMEYLYQTKKDSLKDQRCMDRGVLLIRIPHFVPMTDLRTYIEKELHKKGVRAPRGSHPEAG